MNAILILLLVLSGINIPGSRLLSSDITYGRPIWSPNGQLIAFTSDRSGNFDIWTMDASGGNLTNLTADNLNGDIGPAWSPDGKYLVYDRQSFDTHADIWLADQAGTNRINLTEQLSADGKYYSKDTPQWSPIGNQIAFHAADITDSDIIILNMVDMTFVNATSENDEIYALPAWSPDGEFIAFISYNPNPGLWLATKDGRDVSQIVKGQVGDFSWSPDGTKIAFQMSIKLGTASMISSIVLIDIDSRKTINLTSNVTELAGSPVWSPDGKTIVFEGYKDSNADIWSINSDGTNAHNLTPDEAGDWMPVWSPDGSWIAYVSDQAGTYDIWVMNADGSNKIKLTCQPNPA